MICREGGGGGCKQAGMQLDSLTQLFSLTGLSDDISSNLKGFELFLIFLIVVYIHACNGLFGYPNT